MAVDTDRILREIEDQAKREFLPILGREKGAFLERLVKEKSPCVAVEIGALVGYSTVLIGRNIPEGCMLFSLEISEELARRAEAAVTLAGLSSTAAVIRGDAHEHLSAVKGPVDFVLIDAERSQFLNYLKKIEPKLRSGSVVVANVAPNASRTLAAYFDYVRKSGMFDSSHPVFSDGALEVSVYRG